MRLSLQGQRPTETYGAPLKDFLWTPREQEYFHRARRAILLTGMKEMAHDPRLTLVAREVARYFRDEGRVPPLWFVQFALHKMGSVDIGPFYRILIIKGEGGDALNEELINQAREILGEGKTHFGAGVVGPSHGTRYLAIVAVEKAIALEPLPKLHKGGSNLTIKGRALLPLGDADLFLHIGLPEGETKSLILSCQNDGSFTVTTPLPKFPGRYRIEISQQSGLWGKPLSLFFLYVDAQPPTEFRVPYGPTSDDIRTSEGWAKRLLELINWDRQYFAQKPIRIDQSLNGLAMEDCQLYAKKRDPLGEGKLLISKLQERQVPAIAAHAVVGSASSVEELHSSFMNTPSFRARIISPEVSHVGIGVVFEGEGSQRVYHVLEYFVRLIAEIDPVRWAKDAMDGLNSHRLEAGRPPLRPDPRLQSIAQEFATEIFALQRLTPEILPRLRQAVLSVGFQESSAFDIKIVANLGELRFDQNLIDGVFTHVGIGVGQGTIMGKGGGSRLVGVVTIAGSVPERSGGAREEQDDL